MAFSGSYQSDDVTFLLQPVEIANVPVEEKERLIQSGRRHYSELLTHEPPPDPRYLQWFDAALQRNGSRMAADVACLAHRLQEDFPAGVTLVSLARAGTPIGALLHRTLRAWGRKSHHYSISIVRDRGIDPVALAYILERHPPQSLAFIDGWTGKGAIAGELRSTIQAFNLQHGTTLSPSLYVLADLAGAARGAATLADYLIPSAILNSIVSGLISRTVLDHQLVGAGKFHACAYYREYAAFDRSQSFLDHMMEEVHALDMSPGRSITVGELEERRALAQQVVDKVLRLYGARDVHRVKPGIGEATRALLRRLPERVLLADLDDPDVAHLRYLAEVRDVPVTVAPWLPYRAVTLIKTLGQDS